MRMRALVASALAFALVAAPLAARADNPVGCLVGPNETDRCAISGEAAGILAAILAPAMLSGAAVTIAHELRRHTEERKVPATLTLVPESTDPYRVPEGAEPAKSETRAKPSAAFQFNETATNIATAVTGVAVLGAMIGEIVKDAKGGRSNAPNK